MGVPADTAAPIAGDLVLRFHGTRVETADEVAEIEDALVEILAPGDTLADPEIASTARSIVIVTRNVQDTWHRVLPFLERAGLAAELDAGARVNGAWSPLAPPPTGHGARRY